MKKNQLITRSNYETYMVDYWDGTLTPPIQELLMRFLEENPDLNIEYTDADAYTLPKESLTFQDKNALFKQEVNSTTIDTFLVAELEKDLLAHQQKELNLFIEANPQFKRDRALFALTKIQPDKNLIYGNKSSLKKGAVVPLWIRYSSVAAAACLFLGIGIWWFNQPINSTISLNENLETKTSIIATEENKPQMQGPSQDRNVVQNGVINSAAILPLVTAAIKKEIIPIQTIPTKETVSEDFHSFSINRKADDYLEALINTTMPYTVSITPTVTKVENPPIENSYSTLSAVELVNEFATKNIKKIIKDSALANTIENDKFSIRTRLAQTVGWATGKASKGKVQIQAIPNDDGTLSAMSFTNGKYNYTRRF